MVKFAMNASLETLPLADNLKRRGKRASDLCMVCGGNGKQTLHHILSSCSSALTQGRYTWRHDSVLKTLFNFIEGKLQEGFVIFADLAGKDAGGGHVVPPDILATSQRPDIVVVDRPNRKIFIFELTCPHDTNIVTAHYFKTGKYASLVNDLVALGFKVDLFCVEISVRGQVSKANRARLKSFLLKITGLRRGASVDLISKMSKSSLLGSFSLFCARNEATWQMDNAITL